MPILLTKLGCLMQCLPAGDDLLSEKPALERAARPNLYQQSLEMTQAATWQVKLDAAVSSNTLFVAAWWLLELTSPSRRIRWPVAGHRAWVRPGLLTAVTSTSIDCGGSQA